MAVTRPPSERGARLVKTLLQLEVGAAVAQARGGVQLNRSVLCYNVERRVGEGGRAGASVQRP
jgi:hypothetical protein